MASVIHWVLRHLVLVLVLAAAIYGLLNHEDLDHWLGASEGSAGGAGAHHSMAQPGVRRRG